MNILRLTFIFTFCASLLFGQNSVNQIVSIPVEVTSNHEIIYKHTLKKNETLYSLAKMFKIPLQDLMLINNIEESQTVDLGTQIIVPINSDRLIISGVRSNPSWIPIVYKVKSKETLYRISKGYFNQNIQQLMGRNNLTKLSLNLGQKLIVGWWSTEINSNTKPHSPELISKGNIVSKKIKLDSVYIQTPNDSLFHSPIYKQKVDSTITQQIELPKILSNKGIAIWERSDPNDDFLFVLHKTAKVGSVIKLQHPVTYKIVVAEVVDKLPSGTYSEDVDLVISKAVAEKLGALETRFQVGMTYYE